MSDTHTTDTQNKTNVIDSGIGAIMGEEEFVSTSSSGDIAKMASGDSPPLKPKNVLQLQRKLGNQATMKIIARKQPTVSKSSDGALPFAGLKMVSKSTIQRDPLDGGGGGDDDAKADSDEKQDPDTAVELDGGDSEVKQESDEIDQTISEAQQLQGSIPDASQKDFTGQNQESKPSTESQAVDITDEDDDDDDYGVQVITPMDTDDDMDTPDASAPPVQNTVIKQKQKHKQKQGTHIKGHHLASEGVGAAIGQTVVDVGRNTSTTVEAAEAGVAIKSASSLKDALEGITDTSTDAGSEGISGLLGKIGTFFDVPPMNVILPVASLVYRIYAAVIKHKHMKAFKGLMGAHKGDVSKAKKSSTALKDKGTIGAYGYAKTKRGFWLRVIKAAITVGQVIARLVTVLSGGTAALVSEAVATAASLSNGIIKVGQSLKGIYKMIMGKRGKRRVEGANWIVDAALDGDAEMLQFMLDGEALSKAFLANRARLYKDEMEYSTDNEKLAKMKTLSERPKTTDEMQTYLEIAEELNLLLAVKNQVAIMTKST